MPAGVTVEGLADFRRDLRRVDPRLAKQIQVANKQISTEVAGKASSRVARLGVPTAGRAAGGVRPRANQKSAVIALLGSNPYVRSVVMGTEVHWVFGRPKLAAGMTRRVFRPWIGTDWKPEEGLYGVSPAIASALPDILDTYGDRIMDALAKAFPE